MQELSAGRLTVIIPVYNEAATLQVAVARLRKSPVPTGWERRILVIDDGSTDESAAILAELAAQGADLSVVRHERNQGKGGAIRTGLKHADGDVVLIHDADLEYDPRDHGAVLAPILEGRADAVIGSRFRGGTSHRALYFWHSVANRSLTAFSNALTNLNLSDIECCTKAFTKDVAKRLQLRESGFGIEPEIVARLARMRVEAGPSGSRRLRIFEAPVSYAGRTYAEGKKIRWRDGVWAVWCIIKYRLGS